MIAGLPYDAQVEYLESTGTQWIETGVNGLVDGLKMTIRAASTSLSRGVENRFAATAQEGLIVFGLFKAASDYFWFGANNRRTSGSSAFDTKWHTVVIDSTSNNKSVTFDGTVVKTWDGTGVEKNATIKLFTNLAATEFGYGRISHLKIENVTTHVAILDFIPVRFTNEFGQSEGAMYDRVTKRLFRNRGTGSFLYGPDASIPLIGLWGHKSITARSYVQDGLIAMWDAIENAGWGTHDTNAASWKDVIGGRTIPLASGMSFGESRFIFDNGNATSSTACTLASTAYSTIGSEFTVEFVEKVTKVYGGAGASTNSFLGYFSYHQRDNYANLTVNDNEKYFRYNIVPYGNTYNCSITRNVSSNAMTVRINGNVVTSSSSVARTNSLENKITLTNGWNGNISAYDINSIRIYNRVLTAEEVATNCKIDRMRFGLK